MALSFLYRLAVRVVQLLRLAGRPDVDKDIEILVLRHQLWSFDARSAGRGSSQPIEPCCRS